MRLLFLLVRPMGLEPIWSPTRPSNVRVCHSATLALPNHYFYYYTLFLEIVNCVLLNFYSILGNL